MNDLAKALLVGVLASITVRVLEAHVPAFRQLVTGNGGGMG